MNLPSHKILNLFKYYDCYRDNPLHVIGYEAPSTEGFPGLVCNPVTGR